MKKAIAIAALAVSLWACKSSDSPITPTHAANYFPMTLGSSWAYNTWSDSAGVKIPGSDAVEYDTVVGTMMVQGKNATVVKATLASTVTNNYFLLDSVGNLWQFIDTTTNNTGSGLWLVRAYFSNSTAGGTNTEQFTLKQTVGGYAVTLLFNATLTNHGAQSITVPAGTYSANFRTDSAYADGSSYFPGAFAMRLGHSSYVDGVGIVDDYSGLVVSAVILNRNTGTYRQLKAYHIN